MRYLYYTNYESGGAGLSNGIMSIEIGVVLAHLTNRLLVLDGNASPPANIVAYDGRVNNDTPSRVTDLLDVPLPWVEPDAVDLRGLESLELTSLSLSQFAFYFPKTLDLSSGDARSFARDRNHWVTVTNEHDRIPVLRLSETPIVPGTSRHRNNLSYYSYMFYLDAEVRRSVYRLLQQMQAKRPFAELAARVARDIGPFNAVHLRRGDFKVTYGVTTLDRKPSEAIEAMDQLFSRKDPLVIVTDERDDPFFTEVKLAYPDHYFIDWHILDNYGAEFARLPQTDSLSLAYLSQLVAAESKEFIGTMTSTFTGLIQRYRGNRGKSETFRYLWNELPDGGQDIERGRHAISECIPLDRGQMVEQFTGPYSWNRVSQFLNPAWMREWPESFLLPEVAQTGALVTKPSNAAQIFTPPISATTNKQSVIHVSFENLQVAVWCNDAPTIKRLMRELGAYDSTQPRNVIANFEISIAADSFRIAKRGQSKETLCDKARLPAMLKQQIGLVFAQARHKYAWLVGSAFAKGGRGLVIVGETNTNALSPALLDADWELLDAGLCAIRTDDLMIVPMCARAEPEGAAARSGRLPTPFDRLVITKKAPLHVRDPAIAQLSPGAAVAALIGSSLDFHRNRDRAMTALCRLVENRSVAQLLVSQPRDAAQIISRWTDASPEIAA